MPFTMVISIATLAQSVRAGIEKAAKNPSTKENAAKADVRMHDKRVIADSSDGKILPSATSHDKKKKKYCIPPGKK